MNLGDVILLGIRAIVYLSVINLIKLQGACLFALALFAIVQFVKDSLTAAVTFRVFPLLLLIDVLLPAAFC